MPFKKSPILRQKSSDILSVMEYYRKRTDVIEEICNTKIDLTYKNNGSNYVSQGKNSTNYNINLAKPQVKDIPMKTALYHELSHVLHKTFLTGMLATMKELSRNECVDRFKEMTGRECDSQTSCDQDTVYSWSESLYQLYKIAFNIVEDQRIESLTMKVWLGTKPMFMQMRKKLGDRLIVDVNDTTKTDPTCQMLMYRFLHPEVCDSIALKKSIDSVDGCDERGSVIVWKRLIKPVLDTYFFNKIKEKKDSRDKSDSTQMLPEDIDSSVKESLLDDKVKAQTKLDEAQKDVNDIVANDNVFEKDMDGANTGVRTDEYKEAMKRYEELEREVEHIGDMIEIQNNKSYRAANNERALATNGISYMKHTKNEILESDGRYMRNEDENTDNASDLEYSQALDGEESNLSIEHELFQSKEEGSTQVTEIKNAISGMQVPKEPSHIHKEKRNTHGNKPEPNNTIVNGLVTILRKIKERNVKSIDDSGDEVDVDSYINVKQKGFGNAFESIKTDNGIPLMITVDGSGSMGSGYDGSNMDKARDLVASLFKVAQQHSEITVKANVWSSSSSGDVAITDINSLHECNQISTHVDSNNGYYETPTHEGIRYSARKLKEMRGKNKMLIIITDGHPQFSKNGTHLGKNVITKLCKDAYRQAQSVTPNILCINIEKRSYTAKEMLTDIFGKNYVEFNGMDEASEFVNKTLKRKFVEIFGR